MLEYYSALFVCHSCLLYCLISTVNVTGCTVLTLCDSQQCLPVTVHCVVMCWNIIQHYFCLLQLMFVILPYIYCKYNRNKLHTQQKQKCYCATNLPFHLNRSVSTAIAALYIIIYIEAYSKLRDFPSAWSLNPSTNEILTHHPLTHDNITYASNTSFPETKITKQVLCLQLALEGLKGTKWVTVGKCCGVSFIIFTYCCIEVHV